jgi:hypothetical protein
MTERKSTGFPALDRELGLSRGEINFFMAGHSHWATIKHVGHTSNPEYEKLKNDPVMESLRDRTVKVDVPYLEEWEKTLIEAGNHMKAPLSEEEEQWVRKYVRSKVEDDFEELNQLQRQLQNPRYRPLRIKVEVE